MSSPQANTAAHLASFNSINSAANSLPQTTFNKVGKQAASYNFGKLINETPFKKSSTPREGKAHFAKTLDLNGEKIFDCDSWLISDFYATPSYEFDFTVTEPIKS